MTCAPYPEGRPQQCEGIAEAHLPGKPGCVRIGTECPAGDWPEDLPSDRPRVYVKADVVSGGEGTMTHPFGSITEAIEFAGENAIIALSKGRFDEEVELSRGIVLWGACVAETVLTSSVSSEQAAIVTARYADTELRNLQITGQRWAVEVSGQSAQLHIQDVLIKEAYTLGIKVNYGTLSAVSGLGDVITASVSLEKK